MVLAMPTSRFCISMLLAATVVAQEPGPAAPAGLHLPLDRAEASWHGAEAIADGRRDGAARFDGRSARIDVGPCPILSTEPFTLRCSLRTNRDGFCTPLMARDGEAVGLSLVLGRKPGTVSFEAWSWQHTRVQSTVRVDDGAWHTIEVTYDPACNTAVLFVDGVVQGAAELGLGGSPSARLRLGNNIGADQPFAGDLDDVELLPVTTHREIVRSRAPVLPLALREQALLQLRERLLPTRTPSLGASAAADWPQRRLEIRRHTADALGLSPPPATVPLDVQVHGELVRDGVRLQRISWIGFPGRRATGWLWLPAQLAAGRRPAVLNPHGHWQDGAREPVVQARCAAFAQFGWTALAVDSVHVEHIASGVNSVGAMTWHNQRALDLLLARDDVDTARIAATGASGGGQQTYYLMALEDRLAAAAPMVMACYFHEIISDREAHCGCNHVPRLAARTDVPELCAVFAPRPVMFGSVTGDWTRHFPQQGLPKLRAHWARLHGPEPRSRFADEGHNYDRPMREAVYAFLHDALLGAPANETPRERVAEPAFRPFRRDELAPLLAACAPVRLDANAMANEHLSRRAKVGALAELAPGLDLRASARPIEWIDDEDSPWRRGLVRSDGVPIAFRIRAGTADRTGPITVVIDPAGMAHAIETHASLLQTFERALLVEPRPYGGWAPFRAAWQRNGILLGRGEGYQAALDTAIVCASLPGAGPVHVVGLGEAGVVGLLAAHLCHRITRVTTDQLGANYAQDGNRLPLCPELLRFADLPELIAMLPAGCEHVPLR
jgi:poly(3-hydroxybutyrate) depolymerase